MATNKNKKEVKVRDLKPAKDAKGGAARPSLSGGGGRHGMEGKNPSAMQGKGPTSAQGFSHKGNS